MRYTFDEYFALVQEAAGQRMERDAVQYFYDRNTPYMDTVVKLTYRRPEN